MEAIEAARSGDFKKAEELLKQSDAALAAAHKAHTEILVKEAREESGFISMILIHASNHFSAAEIVREFSEQFIKLYERR